MKINSNLQAMIANNVLKKNEGKNAASTEKLSSGYKLNHASDAPAGMAISNKMNAQIKSLKKARDNTSNAVNVTQTADGALNEVHSMLQRMNVLAMKAANGTMSDKDREMVQEEVDALSKEINRVAADTEYNTQNLLGGEQRMKGYNETAGSKIKVLDYDVDFPKGEYKLELIDDSTATLKKSDGTDIPGLKDSNIVVKTEYERDEKGYEDKTKPIGGKIVATLDDGLEIRFSFDKDDLGAGQVDINVLGIGGMKIQVGSSTGKEIPLVIPRVDTETIGIENIDMRTMKSATDAIDMIADAIDYVSKARSQIGAYQNRFESTQASLDEAIENLTQSYSTIKDVDMADEMVNYTTLQVLVQAGTSMLTQANEQPQQALQLLQ